MNIYIRRFLFLILMLPVIADGQIITTVAGDGTGLDGSPATSAFIDFPDGCAFDKKGNLYFTTVDDSRIRKVTPNGIISTIAGTGSPGYNGDGIPATSAKLNIPTSIAFDRNGNMYIADAGNSRVRKIDENSSIITTIAGNGSLGFGGDGGPATSAILNGAENICFDLHGNLFISDYNNFRIRKVDTFGMITTYAGNGIQGVIGDGSLATAAEIDQADGMCTDKNGNLYISANSNTMIRKINSSGVITTIAGSGLAGPSGDGSPATGASLVVEAMIFDNDGNMYISGYIDNDIRMIDKHGIIYTIAGTGVIGFSGDNGQATAAMLSSTFGITLDTCGNIYVADKDNKRIRKIAVNPTCIPAEVNKIKNDNGLNIYPNPTTTELTITSPNKITQLIITNLIGQQVYTHEYNTETVQVNVAGLPGGIYFIKINGNEVRRFVKK